MRAGAVLGQAGSGSSLSRYLKDTRGSLMKMGGVAREAGNSMCKGPAMETKSDSEGATEEE